MVIDFFYCVLIVFAVINGIRRGLIVAVFSFFAIIIALAAAIKFSAIVAGWLGKTTGVVQVHGYLLFPLHWL